MYPQQPGRLHFEYSTSPEDAYFQRQRYNHTPDTLERIILLVGGTITALLGLRFVFALLDANTANAIVSFVNTTTTPLVTPFFGLFNHDHARIGVISFQGYTLVAMVAYSLLTSGLARLAIVAGY